MRKQDRKNNLRFVILLYFALEKVLNSHELSDTWLYYSLIKQEKSTKLDVVRTISWHSPVGLPRFIVIKLSQVDTGVNSLSIYYSSIFSSFWQVAKDSSFYRVVWGPLGTYVTASIALCSNFLHLKDSPFFNSQKF